jgi:hypothetical protein
MFQRLALLLVCAWISVLGSVGCAFETGGSDVDTFSVRGRLTLDGSTPEVGPACDGSPNAEMVALVFRERSTGSIVISAMPCSAADFRFDADLPRGIWRVFVSPYVANRSNLPDGAFVVADAFEVTGPADDAAFDVETVEVSGRVTVDGVRPILGPECEGAPTIEALSLTFVDVATGTTGASNVPCAASDFDFSLRLPRGIYEATVAAYVDDRTNVPTGRFVANSEFRVSGFTPAAILDVHAE